MGYYKANAKESADNISSSISKIDIICSYIESLAEYLRNDENGFAMEYISNYEEIINTLSKMKNELENYADDIMRAGINVENEVELENMNQLS